MFQRLKLISQLREDYIAHDRRWAVPGFQAVAVHRFGTWAIKARVLRAPLSIVARTMHILVRNVYGIELPFSAQIGRRLVIYHQHGIVVHGSAIIGDDCVIRQGVTLGVRNTDDLYEAPILGHGVDVGCGAKILGAVKIGNGAKIGANAVVLKNVPASATAIGVPAKILGDKPKTWDWYSSHHPTVASTQKGATA